MNYSPTKNTIQISDDNMATLKFVLDMISRNPEESKVLAELKESRDLY